MVTPEVTNVWFQKEEIKIVKSDDAGELLLVKQDDLYIMSI